MNKNNKRYDQRPVSILSNYYVDWINEQLEQITTCASTVARKKNDGTFFGFRKKPRVRIAVVFSHIDNFREMATFHTAAQHFYDAAGDERDIEYVGYSGENSQQFLRLKTIDDLVERAGKGEFDACITFSTWVTMAVRDQLSSKGVSRMPIIFSGMLHPQALGFSVSNDVGSGMVTGVVHEVASFTNQVKTINMLKPEADELLLPYDSELTHGGHTETSFGVSKQFGDAWKTAGGTVVTMPFTAKQDIGAKLVETASEKSIVNISLEGSMLVQTDGIVQACNDHQITTFAHDRTVVRRGAALGTGTSGELFGPGVAACLMDVCIKRLKPHQMPFVRAHESKQVCFQREAMQTQGIVLSEQDQLKLDMLPIEHAI